VFTNFDISALGYPQSKEPDSEQPSLAPAGLPGNDDQAAMASLLSFHLLGLYPGGLMTPSAIIDLLNLFSPIDDTAPYPIAVHSQIYHSQFVLEHQHHCHYCQL
jgi:hypothetical protein